MNHADAGAFAITLFHAVTNAHIMHLQTRSYAQHKALQKFYEQIGDYADTFVESYQGKYGIIDNYPDEFDLMLDPLPYLENLRGFVQDNKEHLPKDTELQNTVDDILNLIDSTVYKLKFLS